MEPRDRQRAADTDREAVAERLRQAVDEGRLDLHEYDERLRQAYTAKTYGELDELLVDLPRVAPAPATAPPVPSRRSEAAPQWLAAQWSGWARVVTICVVIWTVSSLASGEFIYFWPAWVAGPWGAILLCRTVCGLASGEPQRWAARHEHRRASVVAVAAPAVAGGPSAAERPAPRRRCC